MSSVVMYIALGTVSAMCFQHAEGDLLQPLSASNSRPITRLCAFLFGLLVIGPGIPVFCIVMRYNLVVGEVCRPCLATFWGVVLPWLVSWPLYQGKTAATFIANTGTVLLSISGFIAPLVLSLVATGGCALKGLASSSAGLRPSVAPALPQRWLPQQRRYAAALLSLIVPLLMATFYTQWFGQDDA